MATQGGTLTLRRAGGEPRLAEDLPEPTSPGAALWEVGRTLVRRHRMILFTLLALNAIAVVTVKSLTPRYTADASVLIGPRQARVVDLHSVMAGLSGESEVIESEVQLLRSRSIARRVIEKLQLHEDPEFNPALREPGLLATAKSFLRSAEEALLDLLPAAWRPAGLLTSMVDEGPPMAPMARAVDEFLRRLWVAPRGRSRVLQVSFDSQDPEVAAAAVNGLVDAYIEDQIRTKIRATVQAHDWLAERVAELRAQVVAADDVVEAQRRALGITQGVNATVLNEQISAANEQLSKVRSARSEAESRLEAVERALGAPALLYALSEVQEAHVVRNLRQQESALQERLAGQLQRTGDQHPAVLDTRAELRAVQSRIRAEAENIVRGLRARVEAARTQEASLAARLAGLQQQAGRSSEGMVELRALQNEADANRVLYERLLARSRETKVESGLQQPDAQVVSHAEVPAKPSFPNPGLVFPVFFAASCVVTGLLVFIAESLDRGFTTLEQAEKELRVAALGAVPLLKRGSGRAPPPEEYVLRHPISSYGEAIRSLYTSVMLSDADHPPKTILVASALPGEGKTTIAISLARLMAACGKRVVLVDCDLRRPGLHRAFGVPQGPGLVDCLSGGAFVFDAIRRDTASPAWLLPAGSAAHTSPDLFASENMRRLVTTLGERFDLVILDSAPLLAVSDTRNLCRVADKTVLVVRWMDTRRRAALPALRQIFEAGGSVAGVLLSQVDLNRYARYSGNGAYQRRIAVYLNG